MTLTLSGKLIIELQTNRSFGKRKAFIDLFKSSITLYIHSYRFTITFRMVCLIKLRSHSPLGCENNNKC